MNKELCIDAMKDFTEIMKDYRMNEDLFNEEDERVTGIKKALEELQPADKIIMLLYSHFQSLRKVGQILGISHTIIYREVKRIRQEIIEIMNKNRKDDLHKLNIY